MPPLNRIVVALYVGLVFVTVSENVFRTRIVEPGVPTTFVREQLLTYLAYSWEICLALCLIA